METPKFFYFFVNLRPLGLHKQFYAPILLRE